MLDVVRFGIVALYPEQGEDRRKALQNTRSVSICIAQWDTATLHILSGMVCQTYDGQSAEHTSQRMKPSHSTGGEYHKQWPNRMMAFAAR